MESYIPISFLNDFIFCPRSIYFHQLYGSYEKMHYQGEDQIKGLQAHEAIDSKRYSTRKNLLQGLPVYSSKYKLHGKIDTFDKEKGILRERKKRVKTIYDGYVFQLYAQCHSLREMGYTVNKLVIYSMDTNKNYPILLPEENKSMQEAFEKLVHNLQSYNLKQSFQANPQKCARCIYSNLCDEKAEAC